MIIYRKIWEDSFGEIPKDESGRSYDIHHIDGDHSNNDLSNLMCVSIQDHYNIHLSQGDYGACAMISLRMGLSSDEVSSLARKLQNKIIEDGNHNWKDKTTCVNKQGIVSDIDTHTYLQQVGNKDEWEWVANSSKEGAKRRGRKYKNVSSNTVFCVDAQGKKIKVSVEEYQLQKNKILFSLNSTKGKQILGKETNTITKGTVPCIDKRGNFARVDKAVYYSQKGDVKYWDYVTNRSFEAKKRMEKLTIEDFYQGKVS